MAPRKRRRTCTPLSAGAASPPTASALPVELLVEIVARSDFATVVRCAATCKLLRREILTPAFTRRVCGAPPRLVGFLRGGGRRAFSLVHPKTPAAASYAKNHLAPNVSRTGAGLLKEYELVTTRGGLALLERRVINGRRRSERRSDLCVYDPVTGGRAFFPFPPDIRRDGLTGAVHTYALVTAADSAAIGCTFVLLAANMSSLLDFTTTVRVQTASPPGSGSDAAGSWGQWGPVKLVDVRGPGRCLANPYNSAVVLGGDVHWLMYSRDSQDSIFTYDVVTGATGTVELPDGARWPEGRYALEAKLAASPDGRLKLLVANEFTVSVWVLRSGSHSNWGRPVVIDTEATIRSALDPGGGGGHGIEFIRGGIKLANFGDQRTGTVFFRVTVDNGRPGGRDELLVLDVETKEIRRVRGNGGFLYEVDLASRLSAMKIF